MPRENKRLACCFMHRHAYSEARTDVLFDYIQCVTAVSVQCLAPTEEVTEEDPEPVWKKISYSSRNSEAGWSFSMQAIIRVHFAAQHEIQAFLVWCYVCLSVPLSV